MRKYWTIPSSYVSNRRHTIHNSHNGNNENYSNISANIYTENLFPLILSSLQLNKCCIHVLSHIFWSFCVVSKQIIEMVLETVIIFQWISIETVIQIKLKVTARNCHFSRTIWIRMDIYVWFHSCNDVHRRKL